MFAYKEIVVEADVKRINAIKVIKKSGLLKEENFRYYIDKMQKVEYLKRKKATYIGLGITSGICLILSSLVVFENESDIAFFLN